MKHTNLLLCFSLIYLLLPVELRAESSEVTETDTRPTATTDQKFSDKADDLRAKRVKRRAWRKKRSHKHGSRGKRLGGIMRMARAGNRTATFGSRGGAMFLCLDGADPCEHVMMMRLARLYEVNSEGKPVNWVEKFENAEFKWMPPVVETLNGVNRTRVEFQSKLPLHKSANNESAVFNMIAHIYHQDGIAMNGNQELTVKNGSLKFAVNMSNWQWVGSSNSLKLGMFVAIRTRRGMRQYSHSAKMQRGRGMHGKVDRVDLGDGDILDSPELCVVDGVEGKVTTTTRARGPGLLVEWQFPHFQSTLYYDPIFDGERRKENLKSDDMPATDDTADAPEEIPTEQAAEGKDMNFATKSKSSFLVMGIMSSFMFLYLN